jgi:hypothetical protein
MSKMDDDLDHYKRELERLLQLAEEREKNARQRRARELLDRAKAVKRSPFEISALLKSGLDAFIHGVEKREAATRQQQQKSSDVFFRGAEAA